MSTDGTNDGGSGEKIKRNKLFMATASNPYELGEIYNPIEADVDVLDTMEVYKKMEANDEGW